MIQGFPCGSDGKESACNVRDLGSIPGLRRSPGEGKGYPLQYSGLDNSMDCIIHGGHKESDMTEWLSLSYIIKRIIILMDMSYSFLWELKADLSLLGI